MRARYLYSLGGDRARDRPALRGRRRARLADARAGSRVNSTYFARPDNTGLALFRYAVHVEISGLDDHLALGLDAIMFTDKLASNVFARASSTSRPRSSAASRATRSTWPTSATCRSTRAA